MATLGQFSLKHHFIVLNGNKLEARVLIEAIDKHIEKLSNEVHTYSKNRNNQDRVQHVVDDIKSLMTMRDSIKYLASDDISNPHDFPSPLQYII